MQQMADLILNRVALVMEYQCKQIERRVRLIGTEITRLVNEYTQLVHCSHSFQKKMAGNIPAAGGPGSEDQPVSLVCIIPYF